MVAKNKTSTIDYLNYWLKSVNEHGIHSPFVFDLVTNVIYTDKDYYAYKKTEALREKLISNPTTSTIATAALPPKYGKLLFRLVNWFQPKSVIEIGSSCGIETYYMALANSETKVIKLDNDYKNKVLENVRSLTPKNISITDMSVQSLRKVMDSITEMDFVFISLYSAGDLMLYFNQSMTKSGANSVFIINNISSSSEMKSAWLQIKNNKKVRVSIDLFQLGIIFFRTEQVKEHFLVRF